jgi:hypothetical protein
MEHRRQFLVGALYNFGHFNSIERLLFSEDVMTTPVQLSFDLILI